MINLQTRLVFLGCLFLLFLAGFSFAVPTVVISSPANTTYYNRSILLNITVAGNISSSICAYSSNNWANNTTFNCTWTRFNASNGSSIVWVRANDTTGINNTEFVSFTVSPSEMNYSIPSTGGGVRDPYVYDPGVNIPADYSIPDPALWVQAAYVFNETVVSELYLYSIPNPALWVQAAYAFNETAGTSSGSYSIPSTSLWVSLPYVYDSFVNASKSVYFIPSTGLTVMMPNSTTVCLSGNDCASVGRLCINGFCRGTTAAGSDLGQKCSINGTSYSTSPYIWVSSGCTIPSQAQSVQFDGIMNVTFEFPNLKAGTHSFRSFFEGGSNISYATYTLTPNVSNSGDQFANVRLIVTVGLSGESRTVHGEVLD
jgi:hypothetical protein